MILCQQGTIARKEEINSKEMIISLIVIELQTGNFGYTISRKNGRFKPSSDRNRRQEDPLEADTMNLDINFFRCLYSETFGARSIFFLSIKF